jgi:beta-lactamase regulating signal transducer with metallopeptidase domain
LANSEHDLQYFVNLSQIVANPWVVNCMVIVILFCMCFQRSTRSKKSLEMTCFDTSRLVLVEWNRIVYIRMRGFHIRRFLKANLTTIIGCRIHGNGV